MIWFAPLLHDNAFHLGYLWEKSMESWKPFSFTVISFVSKWCWLLIQFLIMCSLTVSSFHWLSVDQLLNTRRKVVNLCKGIPLFERKPLSRIMSFLMLFSGIRYRLLLALYLFFQFNCVSLALHCFRTLIQLGWSFPCFTSCGRHCIHDNWRGHVFLCFQECSDRWWIRPGNSAYCTPYNSGFGSRSYCFSNWYCIHRPYRFDLHFPRKLLDWYN